MAGTRQPTSMVVAKGKKHLTQEEIDTRLDAEIKVPRPKTAKPPKWLPACQKKEFREIGKQLIACGIYSDLDADTLGQYLAARFDWLNAESQASHYVASGEQSHAKEWVSIQNTLFKQCRQCAEALGLTISSRCRLIIPQSLRPDADDGDDEFTQMLKARQTAGFAASE